MCRDDTTHAFRYAAMMHCVKHLAWAIPLSLAATAGHAAEHPAITAYCLTEDLDASSGSPLGKFVMKARLTITGSHYVLDAWNVMPDNPQTLEIHADGTYRSGGPKPIRFIDNWNNHGRGTFTATRSAFHIDIDTVKTSADGSNIGRNYGTYDLKSRGCKWQQQ